MDSSLPHLMDSGTCVRACAPEKIRERVKLLLIVRQTGRVLRPVADKNGALLHQRAQLHQNRKGDALAAAAQIENAITRAARGYKTPLGKLHVMKNHVAVDEVERVALGCVLHRLPAEDSSERTLFPVKVGDVGGEAAL